MNDLATQNQPGNGSPQREVSRGMIGTYKEYFGRGPTKALTTITDTYSATIMSDALTVVERRLAAEGNHETVLSLRRKVQGHMAEDMTALVERATGRKVRCLLSDHDVRTDTAVEILVFEDAELPEGAEG